MMKSIADELLNLQTEIDARLTAAGTNVKMRTAVMRAIDDADKAIQSEFIGYPDTDAARPLRDAYFQVLRMLPHLRHSEPLHEYAEHEVGYEAFVAELRRLIEVVRGRLPIVRGRFHHGLALRP